MQLKRVIFAQHLVFLGGGGLPFYNKYDFYLPSFNILETYWM